jgi:hypothetical protein
VTFGGVQYIGAQDQGNAIYEVNRRYMINNTFSLMFKDSYNFASVDPAQFGTMYVVRNATTGAVTVRGSGGTDSISHLANGQHDQHQRRFRSPTFPARAPLPATATCPPSSPTSTLHKSRRST